MGDRERLHDAVVELQHPALENTRAIVSKSFDELGQQGVLFRDLIRDSAATTP